MKKKVIYYYDEINNDFAGTKIEQKPIDNSFNYIRDKNIFWRLCSFVLYYIIAKPLIFLINKIWNGSTVKNRKVLKLINKKQGFFLYGNHTNILSDAFQPSLIKYTKRFYIIVNPDCTSIPGIQNIVMMLGAIPLASTMSSKINFLKCVKKRIADGHCVTIYPEAHIWPFYTKLRDFSPDTCHYPVKLNVPTFTMTTCYQKHRGILSFIKRPKTVSYIDGPFFPDSSLPPKEAALKLSEEMKTAMRERLDKYSNYNYIEYVKVDDPTKVTIL